MLKKNKVLAVSLLSVLTLALTTLPPASANGGFGRIIVFGDSLSDVGTYAQTAGPRGGGKFTTNPGKLWVEWVAADLHLPLIANREEGFGSPLVVLGGFDYAQGGARVSIAPASPAPGAAPGQTARPVAEQLHGFLNEHAGFDSDDLVFVQGGANDLFAQLRDLKAGNVTPAQAVQNMAKAAQDLVAITERIVASGASAGHVAVLNLPVIAKTPQALALSPQLQGLVSQMTDTFDAVLAEGLRSSGVIGIDIHSFDERFGADYASLGFTNVTQPACNLSMLPGSSSLFCSAQTLVAPGADQTYKYADSIHPTSGYSKVAGEFIITEVARRTK